MRKKNENLDYDKSSREPCHCAECIAYGEYVMWLESLDYPPDYHTMEKLKNIARAYDTEPNKMLEHKDCWQPRERNVLNKRDLDPFQCLGQKRNNN